MRYLTGTFILTVILSLSAYARTPIQLQTSYYSHLKPEHRTVLNKWLADKKWLRPAIESDCTDKEYLAIMRREWRKDFNPFYAVGDFNRDGREDFAVLLVDHKDNQNQGFAIAIFNWPFKRRAAPNYFEKG